MNFLEKLKKEYHLKTEELLLQEESLIQALRGVDLEQTTIEETRIRVFLRKAEEALIDGNHDLVRELEGKIQETRTALDERTKQVAELSASINAIRGKIEKAGQEVIRELYPVIREEVDNQWNKTFDYASEAWKALLEFGREVGIDIPDIYRKNMKFFDYGDRKQLYQRLREFIGTPIG